MNKRNWGRVRECMRKDVTEIDGKLDVLSALKIMKQVKATSLIVKRRDDTPAHRKEMAEKIGFDAYGMTKDMPDPVAHAVNCLLDHMHAMDKQVDGMCKSIRRLGGEMENVELPELGPCDIESTAEVDDDNILD